MPPIEVIGLAAAAALGGAINAVAGGGTLVTFPALLFFGTPSTVANATSTLALVIGTSGSIFGFRQHLPAVRHWLWRFAPVSLAGGLVGAWLLTFTAEKTFSKLVPFLILFATIIFLLQGAFRRLAVAEQQSGFSGSRGAVTAAVIFQTLVAIYGGYFGAGIGILMLAWLGVIGLTDIHQMNTLKTVLGSAINCVAALWFIRAGLVDWAKAAIMTFGAVGGYYLGAHYSQRISQVRVRSLITVIGFVLSGITFYEQFVARR